MILKETLSKTEKSKAFRQWKKQNPEFYLAHAFTMLDEKEKKYRWELGFYNPKTDRLAVVETDPQVLVRPEEEVFKKEGQVKPLDMSKVEVSVARANQACDDLIREKYSAQVVTKRIILLQNIDRQLYNITLVTLSFSLLNVKVDAGTGDVVSHNLQSIMGLGEWQKGGRQQG